MRKLPFVTLVVAAVLAGPALAASPAAQPIDAQQKQELEGDYTLSNGKTMRLIAVDNRLYADIRRTSRLSAVTGRSDRLQLVAIGQNTFASTDGAVSITYQPQSDGAIVLRYGSELPVALAHLGSGKGARVATR